MSNLNEKLAALKGKWLERDDETDPGGRIYRDKVSGEIYHSVTRILGATMPEENKKALENWLERPGSHQTREMAAARGTAAHSSAEYVLKLAQRLARATATKRNSWKLREDGLYRAPKALTKWSLERAIQGAPRVPWSASGYARGLRGWILDHVTSIHAVEFSAFHPAGFAGSADGLLDIDGAGPYVIDWKTSQKSIHKSNESQLVNYRAQLGAYSLMLNYRTGIQAQGGAIVVARRSGAPTVEMLDLDGLKKQEDAFLERCARYFTELPI